MSHKWFNIGGRLVYMKPPLQVESKRSDFACPSLVRDKIDPVQSMADGKIYDTASGLARSHAGFQQADKFDPNNIKEPPSRSVTKSQAADIADQSANMISQGYKPEVVDRNF